MRHPDTPARPLVLLNQLGQGQLPDMAGVQVIDDDQTPAWLRSQDAEVLLTGPRNGWKTAPQQAPEGWPGRLRWVHLASAGIDFFPSWLFDVAQVSCSRGVAADPIAEYVLSAMLEQVKQLHGRQVRHGRMIWSREFDRAVARPLGTLKGQTLGLLGYGAIGQAIARRALAFDMRILALRRSGQRIDAEGVTSVASLRELLANSDHLVLALPLTAETRHLIDAEALSHAKPGLHLINIARGALLDHDALRAALDRGALAAATLDVTEPEPPPQGHWLYQHPRVRLTPHISWSASDGPAATALKFQHNLVRYLKGDALIDRVDPSKGY